MQLNKSNTKRINFKLGLAVATSGLLGTTLSVQAEDGWQLDSGLMVYSEGDSRVQAIEPAIGLKRIYDDESVISGRIVYDALSGASPNGAAKASIAQTFTSASGNGDMYTTNAGELPVDDSFRDARVTVSGNWEKPLDSDLKMNLGGAFSKEYDFTSMSVNGAIAKTFNQKNTTVSLGINLEFDDIYSFNDTPVPLSNYWSLETTGQTEQKDVTDIVFGVTQNISRRWIMQFNTGLSSSTGYHDDPYKIITVADNGNLIDDPENPGNFLYLVEHRPEDRQKLSLYWQNKWAIGSDDSIDLGLRLMDDDWGIQSTTLDLTYHWGFKNNWYLEPHLRYYDQSAADFYYPFLSLGDDVAISGGKVNPLVEYASSDPRLGAFSATTVGLKLGLPITERQSLSIRAEFYQQQDQNQQKAVATGSHLDGQDQFAELSATWLQLGYSIKW